MAASVLTHYLLVVIYLFIYLFIHLFIYLFTVDCNSSNIY